MVNDDDMLKIMSGRACPRVPSFAVDTTNNKQEESYKMKYDWNTVIQLEKRRTTKGVTKFTYKPLNEIKGDLKHRLEVLFKESEHEIEILKAVEFLNDEHVFNHLPHALHLLLTHLGGLFGKRLILPPMAKL